MVSLFQAPFAFPRTSRQWLSRTNRRQYGGPRSRYPRTKYRESGCRLRIPPRPNLRQPLGDSLLHSAVGGLVELRSTQVGGQAFHSTERVLVLVRVLIPLAVTPLLHRTRRRIPK